MADPIAVDTKPIGEPSRATFAAGNAEAHSARVQSLRGLACLLLVAFHVIGSHSDSGMVVPDNSWWRAFANIFTPLRMPLFTFLSGFVYAYRPVNTGKMGLFIRKKFIRLWLPLLTVSTLYYLATLVVPDATGQRPIDEAWRIYFFNYVHFWFLQAIILIFAATLVLEKLGALETLGRFSAVLAVALVLSSMANADEVSFMSWRNALHLAPFFLLGLGANRYFDALSRSRVVWSCAMLFAVTMGTHAHHMATWSGIAQANSVLDIAIGVTGTLTLIWFFPYSRVLATLGAFSFAVYLFHPFFVAFARKMLGLMHVTGHGSAFMVCLTAGLIGPAILDRVVSRIPVVRTALLGQR